mmetsp:Transcript_25104/g.83727  ORF Transcript_25104/g.83727 Transcript_25104/m.83727 type:complete len:501 (+) Transcript_25104:78-1580(+)|eukprot:CAMPEP_0203946784 /NCGR_PEP_ID=MMETSP0359-20131031/81933_1 /ASSEMBLY_ACC=CAM_ASM_000338 /TAXON_ID=268821 /ORGANISM="Scrippsiella Hangoei, Strain SHTV-5" /LENGTH=500 /DNA_ID=CAMNT_0050878123 /DNA_START=61 /DNA_END=1563 /DNA_ORIENTATION=-
MPSHRHFAPLDCGGIPLERIPLELHTQRSQREIEVFDLEGSDADLTAAAVPFLDRRWWRSRSGLAIAVFALVGSAVAALHLCQAGRAAKASPRDASVLDEFNYVGEEESARISREEWTHRGQASIRIEVPTTTMPVVLASANNEEAISIAMAEALHAADVRSNDSPGGTAPETATTTSTRLPCGNTGDDCSLSRCCNDPNKFCFLQTHAWGSCFSECVVGIHPEDPSEYQQPWSCKMLSPVGQPEYPSLFCFMAVQSHGQELEMAQHQATLGTGIFACDDYAVFSDKKMNLTSNIQTRDLQHFAAPMAVKGALTATWVNTEAFVEAWGVIVHMPEPWKNDWMVKVDPDAVFFPVRLKVHLQEHAVQDADSGAGVFLKNCMTVGDLQLYGSLEVISHKALGALSDRKTRCDGADNARMGEDMWLQKCLQTLGGVGLDATGILRDRYCPVGGSKDCAFGAAAFHPYKALAQWDGCRAAAMAPAVPAPAPPVLAPSAGVTLQQ